MSEFAGAVDSETGELVAPIVDEADLILSQDQTDNGTVPPPALGSPPREPFDAMGPPVPPINNFPAALVRHNDDATVLGLSQGPALTLRGARPFLRRDGSVPAPRLPPPPTPPPQVPAGPSSLAATTTSQPTGSPTSLQQVRKTAQELPRLDPTPYAFSYDDAASFPEELEEWFSYTIEERGRISVAQLAYGLQQMEWKKALGEGDSSSWLQASDSQRQKFMQFLTGGVAQRASEIQKANEEGTRDGTVSDIAVQKLEALTYLALGAYGETAGLHDPELESAETYQAETPQREGAKSPSQHPPSDPYKDAQLQLTWIRKNTLLFLRTNGAKVVLDIFRASADREFLFETMQLDSNSVQRQLQLREVWCAQTLLYICLEVIRSSKDAPLRLSLRADFLGYKPNLLVTLSKIINDLRWDETVQLSSIKILLLTWKSALVLFGGLSDVEGVKDSFQEKNPARHKRTKPLITASPLEYHSFRQEISSKYPAYNPPPSTFQLDPDQKSMLPPLKQGQSRPASVVGSQSDYGGSILHQPVHIATPAPSPPPSPAAKGGKKQNYQTNQLFPFLYPPLDPSSNQLGGKGTTSLQDSLVSRKWEGSDVPKSISEASELFASRIRATRALRQLWEARTDFMKYDRGWDDGDDESPVLEFNLDADKDIQKENNESEDAERLYDGSPKDRLQTVEDFYRDGLPYLQSIIMAFLKTIMSSLTNLMAHHGFHQNGNQTVNEAPTQNGNGTANGADSPELSYVDKLSLEDLETFRIQEIMAKASSGLILSLLKWFKISHVLKFEYMTQLLVDANFIPIVLKLFQTQETGKAINFRMERDEYGFWKFCWKISKNWKEAPQPPKNLETPISPPQPQGEQYAQDGTKIESDDEACPPPIARTRTAQTSPEIGSEEQQTVDQQKLHTSQWPEVDELGVPTAPFPIDHITSFSWRNFFSAINYLRILQKVCKHKAHRNLMLVTYKSGAYLKKSLKIPQGELRLYTLKLFKNQVPYCSRKWRSSNMRVITAVYLYCRPELRDDWLLSTDVDNDVEQAVPMEQSLRSLTHFYNLKGYAEQMGAAPGVLSGEERSFFVRELERIDWADDGLEDQMSLADGHNARDWGIGVHPVEHM